MNRFLIGTALLAAAVASASAHTLDGLVKDNKTGEPLIGTVVRVKELPGVSATTGSSTEPSRCMSCPAKAGLRS